MSPGPRRNFRNMGFHFLTPIFHFLSKPEPNEKLVAYSMITHTWSRKTHFDKIPKKFRRQNAKNQLSLSKLSFDKKYWLNFLKLPFSSRHTRSKTRPNILYESSFHLPRYLASICIWPGQIPTPESVFIHLPASCTILAHLCLTVGWQLEGGALGYPRPPLSTLVGYPSALPSNCQPTAERKCARVTNFAGRWVPGAPRVGFRCRQFVRVSDSWG